MKKLLIVTAVLMLLTAGLSAESLAKADEFCVQKGDLFLGVSIGLNYFASSLIYGANAEYILTDKVGIGKIGIGAMLRYWQWDYWSYEYSYTYIGAQGNYHFDFGGPKLDLYAGFTLGYGIFNSNWSSATVDSALLFSFHAGARYKLSERLFLTGRIGGGGSDFGGIEAGVDIRL